MDTKDKKQPLANVFRGYMFKELGKERHKDLKYTDKRLNRLWVIEDTLRS